MGNQMDIFDLDDQENINVINDALHVIATEQRRISEAQQTIKENRSLLFDCLMKIPRTERKVFIHKYDSFDQNEFICAICENAHRAMQVTPIPGWSQEIKEY